MFEEMNILKVFFEDPARQRNVREIARLLRISPATASKKLKSLRKAGFLYMKRVKNIDFYSADMESDAYRDLKIYYNIRKLREAGLVEELDRLYFKPAIILFGSASRGMDTKGSDFDIVVISERKKTFNSAGFERALGRKLHVFVVGNIKELRNEFLINNVLNGILVQGEIK